ncbi:HDOD domain-containing protein [Leptospira ilyithenensis]|uniref:HDOD domain-containing protein n=1 Tax=Leptospira ilyithenensis TaxID=2484901 RepID=A0A4R9LWG0_9LEPT|nr:HDOD domain-containing protein [Leptospira ilyithenensis]TGN14391.1 HDOD domain-containing protein [Leptospira ilyithenensis]
MSSLAEYLTQIKDLTIVPPVLISILSLEDDNELSFGELEKKVQSDQILVARLLKLANSPFFSRGNSVANMKQVITRLGFKTVRSMVAMAMTDSLFRQGNYKKFRDEVWDHSIAKGILAQFLCEEKKMRKEAELSLTCGLMQDLGKIVLNTIDRAKYVEVLGEFQTTDKSMYDLEKAAFGVDSVEMGAAAARLWKLPDQIIEVIEDKSKKPEEQSVLGQIIGFGGTVARMTGHGKKEPDTLSVYESYQTIFGLGKDQTPPLIDVYGEKLKVNELYQFCSTL